MCSGGLVAWREGRDLTILETQVWILSETGSKVFPENDALRQGHGYNSWFGLRWNVADWAKINNDGASSVVNVADHWRKDLEMIEYVFLWSNGKKRGSCVHDPEKQVRILPRNGSGINFLTGWTIYNRAIDKNKKKKKRKTYSNISERRHYQTVFAQQEQN